MLYHKHEVSTQHWLPNAEKYDAVVYAAGGSVLEVSAAGPYGSSEWANSGVCAQAGQAGFYPAHWPQYCSGTPPYEASDNGHQDIES